MFRNRFYLAVVSGHFAVDTLNSMGAVLLAVLAVPLNLSNHQIGLAITIYLLAGSLSQPLFGVLSDRLPGRSGLLAGISIAWMALFFCLVAFAQTWTFILPFFLLAALGSGLFHPIGTAAAAAAHPERANSATAVFFFCGQMGLAIGPVLAGVLAGYAGSIGIVPIALLALLPAGLLFWIRRDEAEAQVAAAAVAKITPVAPIERRAFQWSMIGFVLLAAFVLLVATRSSVQAVYQSFLPKLFSDRGWEPAMFGALAGAYMGAAAIGNVAMGAIADRFGMRAATVGPLVFSVPVALLGLTTPSLVVAFTAIALAGFLVGGQHSVLVVHAQRLLPTGKGLAAGLILGFTFASGAVGTWIVGFAADAYSLETMMRAVVWLGLPAALLALTLPARQRNVTLPTLPVEAQPAAASAD